MRNTLVMHPVLIDLPPLGLTVDAYPTMVALAVVVGWWLGPRWAEQLGGIPRGRARGIFIALTFVAFAGARLHYVLNTWGQFAEQWTAALVFWAGGLHAGGGILALVLLGPLVFRAFRVPIRAFADVLAPTFGVTLAIVRVGCFLKGCCFGAVCHAPWCVMFPRTTFAFLLHADRGLVDAAATHTAPIHPLQLYFAAAALLLAAISRWLYPHRRYDGQVALVALLFYSASSAALEFLRADTPGRVYWGPLPQLAWTALALAAGSALALGLAEWRHRHTAPVREAHAPPGMKGRTLTMDAMRIRGILVTTAVALALSAVTARAGTPLSYGTTWTAEDGSAKAVAFEGTAERGVVSGTLRIEGMAVRVNGVIALDGSVSGTVKRPDGTQVATFTGRPDEKGVLRGSATFAGRTQPWSADGVVLPSATAP